MEEAEPTHVGAGRNRGRLVLAVALAVLAVGALAWTIKVNIADNDQIDDPVPCTSTVYEGCPSRWEAEWATPTG